jgi:hypothetical protein
VPKYIALGVKGYDFLDEKGEKKTGATLIYLDEPIEQGLMRGFIPFSVTIDLNTANTIPNFPCYCELEFKRVPDAKGKAKEVFKSFKYLEYFSIV